VEWSLLIEYAGGTEVAAARLKEAGSEHWTSGNYSTDEYGFTALPGGRRQNDGDYSSYISYGYFWTSVDYSPTYAYSLYMFYHNYSTSISGATKKSGQSVRCIKD